jgi:hypothetical protein
MTATLTAAHKTIGAEVRRGTFDATDGGLVAYRCTGKSILPVFLLSFAIPRLALSLHREQFVRIVVVRLPEQVEHLGREPEGRGHDPHREGEELQRVEDVEDAADPRPSRRQNGRPGRSGRLPSSTGTTPAARRST